MSHTTILGVLTIVGGLVAYAIAFLSGHGQDAAVIAAVFTAITTGFGLIKAQDATP